jgi:tetratricopeptide (TPR) repeat protein
MKSNNPRNRNKSSKLSDSASGSYVDRWVFAVILVATTCAAFFPALRNEFVDWDDYENLVNNASYRGLGWDQLRWMFTTFHLGHYQPLSWMTLGLDHLIWGTDPFGYHLTNLIIHAANAILFYLVCRRLLSIVFALPPERTRQPGLAIAAGLAALVFAVHPLRAESVAWVTERRDVLSALFFLASIDCYLRAQWPKQSQSRRGWLSLALVACVLSLLSKATAVTLPLVLLLFDVYPLGRLPGRLTSWFKPDHRHVLFEKLPFFMLAGVFGLIALSAQQHTGALRPVQQYFLSHRVAQSFYGVCFYLWKSLFPARLSPLYELPFDFAAWAPLFLFCGAAAVSITLVLYRVRRRWPGLLASWLYYNLMLAPVSGVAQSGPQLAADRYTYLSCLSWSLLLGGGFYYLSKSAGQSDGRRRLFVTSCTLAVPAVIVLGTMAWQQTKVWRDTRTLWEHVIAVGPPSSIAFYNMGRMIEHEGDNGRAMEYYQRSLAVNPTLADAHHNLARLLARNGQPLEAMEHYRRALEVKPRDADTHNNLGLLLAMRGEIPAALREFQTAVEIDPNYGRAYFNMARVFARQGDVEKSVQSYRHALKVNPDEVEIHLGLGEALARQGQLEEAAAHFQEAIKIQPTFAEAHVALARLLANQSKKDEAEKHYQEALRLLKSNHRSPPPHSRENR